MTTNVFKSIKWKQVLLFAVAGGVLSGIVSWTLKPDMIDYVNVALVPELAEEIGADLTTRLQLAHIGHEALRSAQGFGMVQGPGRDIDEQVLRSLKFSGMEVFDLLTVEQRKAFYFMFRSRDILPIKYHTDESDVPGIPRFTLAFGWKEAPETLRRSIEDTATELERAWEMIPSKSVATALASHDDQAISDAADTWLGNNSPKKTKRSKTSFEERTSAMRARHEERTQERRRDFDRRVAENRAALEQHKTEARLEAERESAERNTEFERRRAQMRADYEKRAAEMRAEHERRVQKMLNK